MYLAQSLDGDALSVIENPAAVGHRFHSENTAGVTVTKGVPGWFKGIQSMNHGKDLSCVERHKLTWRTEWKQQSKVEWSDIKQPYVNAACGTAEF